MISRLPLPTRPQLGHHDIEDGDQDDSICSQQEQYRPDVDPLKAGALKERTALKCQNFEPNEAVNWVPGWNSKSGKFFSSFLILCSGWTQPRDRQQQGGNLNMKWNRAIYIRYTLLYKVDIILIINIADWCGWGLGLSGLCTHDLSFSLTLTPAEILRCTWLQIQL